MSVTRMISLKLLWIVPACFLLLGAGPRPSDHALVLFPGAGGCPVGDYLDGISIRVRPQWRRLMGFKVSDAFDDFVMPYCVEFRSRVIAQTVSACCVRIVPYAPDVVGPCVLGEKADGPVDCPVLYTEGGKLIKRR